MKKIFRDVIVGLFLLFAWPWFLYRRYGCKNFRPQGKLIIVCNHYSDFDPLFIYLMYGRRRIWFVADSDTKKRKLSRFLTSLFDCVFVNQQTVGPAYFRQCAQILQEGGVLCIFPEGFVNPRKYGFFDFKSSFISLARQTQADILPLYLYPALQPFCRSKVYIGSLISPQEYEYLPNRCDAAMYVQGKVMTFPDFIEKEEQGIGQKL